MSRITEKLNLAKRARPGRLVSLLGVAVLFVTAIVVPYSSAGAGSPDRPIIVVTCNAGSRPVGPFDVACAGSASGFVQVTASTTTCGSASGSQSSCELRYWAKSRGATLSDAISFIGGGVLQAGPISATTGGGSGGTTGSSTTTSSGAAGSTGAAGSSGVSSVTTNTVSAPVNFMYRKITWTYSVRVPGKNTRVLTVVVTTVTGHALENPTFGVQDSKNIADGAAQQVAVE